MNWFKKLFEKKKLHNEIYQSKENELLSKLEASINQCTMGIKKAGDEMDQIRKWANEAIRSTFEVPNKFWYEELNKYNEIKALKENKEIDFKLIIKCDEITSAYLEQIKLREAKLNLYQSLIEKYQQNKAKMATFKKRHNDDIMSKSKLDALEEHRLRLEQMKTNPENTESTVEESYQLEEFRKEADEVLEEFEISEEVRAHLEKINSEFKSGYFSSDSKFAIEQIENLTNKIRSENLDQ